MIVGDLLRLEDLRLGLAWGTPDLLDRPVTGVTSTDLQDPARYLQPGELVLSGLVWWKPELEPDAAPEPDAALRFATSLSSARVAALLAGEGTHGRVPPSLVEACRIHGIPLISVPAGTSFRAVTDQVYLRLWGDLSSRSERAWALPEAARQELATLLEAGAPLARLLSCAAARLGLPPCAVRSGSGRLIAVSTPTAPDPSAAVQTAAQPLPRPPGRRGPGGPGRSASAVRRRRGADRSAGGRALRRLAADRGLGGGRGAGGAAGPAEVGRPLPGQPAPPVRRRPVRPARGRRNRRPGRLRACAGRLRAVRRGAVDDRLGPGRPGPGGVGAGGADRAAAAGRGALRRRERRAGDAAAVVAGPLPDLRPLLPALQALLGPGQLLRIGVGPAAAATVAGLRGSLVGARYALASAAPYADAARLDSLAALLAGIPAEVASAFHERLLGRLVANDREHGVSLMGTLAAFLEHDGSWSRTAKALHVHVNTVHYRARRIEELTGRSLVRLADQADLRAALLCAPAPAVAAAAGS